MPLVSCPRLLVLALAFPGMSHALGLGDIRVESRLNEPLSAQIDIIGATPLRDVEPGEIVSLTDKGIQTRMGVTGA